MESLKTPGVYFTETSPFASSIVAVPTAVPIFIGYTERSPGRSLFSISAINDFEQLFGKGPSPLFSITPCDTKDAMVILQGKPYAVAFKNTSWYLYNSIRLFYANGGARAYVLSIGSYTDTVTLDAFGQSLSSLIHTPDVTLLVYPDALLLSKTDYYTWVNATLEHCNTTQNKMTLMDVYGGNESTALGTDPADTRISDLRNLTGSNGLCYGAAYFPWVETTIVSQDELSCLNFSIDELTACLSAMPSPIITQLLGRAKSAMQQYAAATTPEAKQQAMQEVISAHNGLMAASEDYQVLVQYAFSLINILPVTPAMAGVFTAVDANNNVATAPANVSLQSVTDTCSKLTDSTQGSLNVDAQTGKSVNGIRLFPNMGVVVWGARTLDGNSNDWRYINVRRTLIMIEQSISLGLKNYMFEPNASGTWSAVDQSISAFLTGLWQQGILMGSKASDAFTVAVGLGSTMTSGDILNGYMNVSVLVCVAHPAEFIQLAFQQQMQTS